MTNAVQLLNDQEEAMRQVLDGRQVGMWTAIPGIIQSVNRTKMTCEVQPSIQAVLSDQNGDLTSVNLPLLINVPIVFPSGGGFLITIPLAAGDEVLVVFSSRCIDAWWQNGGFENIAMEARMHDLSDGFAIPGPRSIPKIPAGSISATDLQIRNDAGTSYVSITADGKIKLVAPTEIDVTVATLKVTGDLQVTGTITGGTVKQGTVNLGTHIHSGVTVGGGDTGVPVP